MTRRVLFNEFWKMSWKEKKIYILVLIETSPAKSIKSAQTTATRDNTHSYFLPTENGRKQVCRQMFLSTFGMKEKMLRIWIFQKKKSRQIRG
jgi:hypothetical protein